MKRGEIYFIDLGETVGSEINKNRPCVIIQNDMGNTYSNTTIVLPITHAAKKIYPTQLKINEELMESEIQTVDGIIKTEQIRTVDKSRIGNFAGTLTAAAMKQVNNLILTALGI